MGKRGPAKQPTKLRLLNGARPDKVNQSEPVARDALPVAPDGLDPEVEEVWDYTIRELDVMGIASSADRDTLLAYCEAVVQHRKASRLLRDSNVLVIGLHGKPVANPAVGVQNRAAAVIRAFAQEFGLSPSARASIETDRDGRSVGGADDDPFAGTGS